MVQFIIYSSQRNFPHWLSHVQTSNPSFAIFLFFTLSSYTSVGGNYAGLFACSPNDEQTDAQFESVLPAPGEGSRLEMYED